MSDGTTAIHISPIEETEMNHAQAIFKRMADAVVQASELSTKVAELIQSVNSLKTEIDAVRSSNRWLDEQLQSIRQARDNLTAELGQARQELAKEKADADEYQRENTELRAKVADLEVTLDHARKERDDHAYESLVANEALAAANSKLAKFRELLGEPEPKPAPAPAPVEELPAFLTKPIESAKVDPWDKPTEEAKPYPDYPTTHKVW